MKYILILTLVLIPSLLYADGVDELRKAIDYEFQKKRYVSSLDQNDNKIDRGKIISALNRFNRVGFQPVVSILPEGVSYNVGPVIVSADRRYVRIGLAPFFSNIGRVDTFTFSR